MTDSSELATSLSEVTGPVVGVSLGLEGSSISPV